MKVIIAGCRDYKPTANEISKALKYNPLMKITELVCGMCSGVDAAALNYAVSKGIPVKEFPADWDKHGRAAGPIRNEEMAKYGDVLIAFWDGVSRGTKSMIELAKRNNLQVHIVRINARKA